jgi:DNA-binding XRE family transcriptional regulator
MAKPKALATYRNFEDPQVAVTFLRSEADMNVRDIAQRVECNRVTIWRIETGKPHPTSARLARALQKLAKDKWRKLRGRR